MDDVKDKTEDVVTADIAPPADQAAPEAAEPPAPADAVPPETVPDTPAETPAPAETAPPKFSEAFRSRIKNNHPDQDFSDDETYFQKASEELDNLEAYRNKNIEANKALAGIFDAEPVVVEVLKDMFQGASFREALARHFSPEELTPQEGEPDREGWKKNAETRAQRMADEEKKAQENEANTEFSTKSIQEFAKETNLSDEQATEFLNKVGEALDEVYAGKISKSFLNSMYRALNYDKDLETAKATGEIAGRNAKIDIKKEKENKPSGDGMPVVKGGETQPAKEGPKKDWVSNLIDTEKKKQIL
jgi:hypothetical protein